MAILDWSQCPAVESVPGRLSGAWVFRDTRMPVSAVFENLEAGATVDEIAEWFSISKAQVIEVLEFAARSLAAPVPVEPISLLFPMLVLFDHSTPAPLSAYLTGHEVTEARNRGWDRLSNGDLLAEAERAGFEVFLTADKNIRYQQNLANTAKILDAVNAAQPGSYFEVHIP